MKVAEVQADSIKVANKVLSANSSLEQHAQTLEQVESLTVQLAAANCRIAELDPESNEQLSSILAALSVESQVNRYTSSVADALTSTALTSTALTSTALTSTALTTTARTTTASALLPPLKPTLGAWC